MRYKLHTSLNDGVSTAVQEQSPDTYRGCCEGCLQSYSAKIALRKRQNILRPCAL
ncbi:hypothetical protein PAE0338 [Pyrobaculum aerophilum str. IM2]|uniref:Uncharacterized protein n=1 Tax=Pyrobaculum aerophilum (strain ATCC 51768 / DSM 7523 / JCM 9630 / CIP 104966 / NBRC 100827 / IM2) TaxID=178306 RepID=Q8ZZB7_PYRAE|nr:hypothetical protein PAE0338 [Pyrobaculum aerophilum str. IM2]